MARPLLARGELRNAVEVYFSPVERGQIASAAQSAGLPLSAFVRRAALRQQVHAVPMPNARKWEELARLAANLNQLAAAANRGEVVGITAETLDSLRMAVQALRLDLIGGGGS